MDGVGGGREAVPVVLRHKERVSPWPVSKSWRANAAELKERKRGLLERVKEVLALLVVLKWVVDDPVDEEAVQKRVVVFKVIATPPR